MKDYIVTVVTTHYVSTRARDADHARTLIGRRVKHGDFGSRSAKITEVEESE